MGYRDVGLVGSEHLRENWNAGGLVRIWKLPPPLKSFPPAMPPESIFTKYMPCADPRAVKSSSDQMSLTSMPALFCS